MEPLKRTVYKYEKDGEAREFIIQEKDYGEMIVFDIFFGDIFLFTVSQEGAVIFSDWEAAGKPPVNMDEDTLREMCRYISNQKT